MGQPKDPRAGYIAIATDMFAAHGYHGTSLAAVARAGGVTKQALLHFFGTKEALYAAVLTSLSHRLMSQIETSYDDDPVLHLTQYFDAFLTSTRADPGDVRLVVRALLDSNPDARKWPLKPYLDRLSAIVKQAQGGGEAEDADVMAWLSQMIGMVQYIAISGPAVSGMYGAQTAEHMADRLHGTLAKAIREFAGA
ncbi:TetR/AcrR family transcriptional regulator [Shimia ponticola]|uniref:TetR/AcrR family transcriptional regulator n=1 Tax=Shimia ponticola TaxID=2582893 RepID=UPI0011BE88F4|nr:TetR/AcrR family transcriptional regulator [Shimia ponticola]